MKIALAFFGITRSLKYTIQSIKSNVLEVFKGAGVEYEIFMHTYRLDTYANRRTGERLDVVDNEEYRLLEPNHIQIDSQDEIKVRLHLQQYRTHADPWKTGYNSVDNYILAQWSKLQVVNMIEATGTQYDYVIYLRPDVLYIHKFKMAFLTHVNDGAVCIPNFHLFGKYKTNDRFSITNMATYKIYGGIFESLLDMSKKRPLHSETILGEIFMNAGIKLVRINFKFCRIRCNGSNYDKALR
jgi:hypothetical protein